jgi:nucleoside-diphosphate-sugar epimerase
MKVMLTGATGFIGTHLVRRLVEEGHTVRTLVRNSSKLTHLRELPVDVTWGDIRDKSSLIEASKDVEVIYHLASLRDRWGRDDETMEVNFRGTRSLLDAASRNGVGRFIYCSSVSVFGFPSLLPIDESFPYQPVVAYGVSKMESEILVRDYGSKYGLPWVIVRPVITYGPGDKNGFLTKLIRLVSNRLCPLIGSGNNRVHLCYIEDTTRGLLLAMRDKALGRDYIIAGRNPVTIRDLAGSIEKTLQNRALRLRIPIWLGKLTGSAIETWYKSMGLEDSPPIDRHKVDMVAKDRCYDISRAEKELGFTPQVDYAEGFEKTINWLKSVKGHGLEKSH